MAQPVIVAGRDTLLPRLADTWTFALVILLGAWTGIYQLALLLSLTRNQSVALAIAALVLGTAAAVRSGMLARKDPTSGDKIGNGSLLPASLGAAVALLAAFAWEGSLQWTIVALGLAVVGMAGLARAAGAAPLELDRSSNGLVVSPRLDAALVGTAIVISLILAIGVVRPNEDDVDLFSRSSYIEAEAGEFPTEDVIYDPPQGPARHRTSYEPLVGAVAAALPWRAADVVYLLFPPLIAVAAVASIYLLAREFVPATAAFGVLAAVVYLALDGGVDGSFGNHGFVRIWQGKALMLIFLVPLCWRFGILLLDRLDARAVLGWMAGLAAMAGMARTGTLLAPAMAGAVVVTAVVLKRRSAIPAILAGAGFPMVLLVARIRLPGAAAGIPAALAPSVEANRGVALGSWPWVEMMSSDWTRLVAAAAMCGVVVFAGRRAAVATLATSVIVFGAFFAFPLSVEVADRVVTAGGNAWRTLWFVPVPALVGISVAQLAARVRTPAWRAGVATIAIAVIAGAMLAGPGRPTWSAGNDAEVRWFSWKLPRAGIDAALVLEDLRSEGVVAAPRDVSQAVAIIHPGLHPVAARFLVSRDPAFDSGLRKFTLAAVTDGIVTDDQADSLSRAVAKFGITHVCTPPTLRENRLVTELGDEGFVLAASDEWCDYWLKE